MSFIRRGRDTRGLSFFLRYEDTRDESCLQARKRDLTSGTLILDFPGSRTMRKKKCLLFETPSLWHFVTGP